MHTSHQDSVGLVLNALLQSKVLEPDPKLHLIEPSNLANATLELKEGAKFGSPFPVRALR